MITLNYKSPTIYAVFGVFLIAIPLALVGQPLICTCGEVKFWVGSVFDGGNSQHIADWYTLSHILHGVLIALLGRIFFPKWRFSYLFVIAITTGVAWELVEHSQFVLAAFRATTINAGYLGDSVLNAVADYIWMLGGFFAAYLSRTIFVLITVAFLELTAVFFARDSLALTTLMLVYPVDAVENWQQELNPNRVES